MGLQYVQMGEKQGLLPIRGQNQCRQLTFAVKTCLFKDAFTAEPVQRLQDSRQQCWTRMCGMNAAGQTYLHQKPARFYLPLPSKAEKRTAQSEDGDGSLKRSRCTRNRFVLTLHLTEKTCNGIWSTDTLQN